MIHAIIRSVTCKGEQVVSRNDGYWYWQLRCLTCYFVKIN